MIFFIIWLLFGLLGVWITWHSIRKDWYTRFHCEYWNDYNEFALHFLLYTSPIFIIGGFIVFAMPFIVFSDSLSFYFKIPKDEI